MSLPPIGGSPSLLKALQKALQHNVSPLIVIYVFVLIPNLLPEVKK